MDHSEGPGTAPPVSVGLAQSTGAQKSDLRTLFLTGFLVLFLELACIRWFGAYVVFLQFFTNIVLIACFLGMSIGCLCAGAKTDWLKWFPGLALGTIGLAILLNGMYFHWSELAIGVGNQSSPQVVFFGTEYRNVDLAKFVIPIELLAGVFFVLITLMFIGPGQVLGRCFDRYPNRVLGYTSNILGSIAGIVAFGLISFAHTPPAVWFLIGFAGVGYFLHKSGKLTGSNMLALGTTTLAVAIAGTSLVADTQVHWSPYYKVEHNLDDRSIAVNHVSHQSMRSWEDPAAIYSAIHLLQKDSGGEPFEDVMIIGAGSGNDVAYTLHHGARLIDAVEIDPVIHRIGQEHHPDRPYDDPRVRIHVDDGRSFLRTTDHKYDLVTYALVDSLILHSSYSSIRLESFLFTEEAFRDVRRALKPDGVFVMYNYFRQGWIIDRITRMLENEFGRPPLVFSFPHQDVINADDNLGSSITMVVVGSTDRIAEAFQRKGQFWLNHWPERNLDGNGFDREPAMSAGSPDDPWCYVAPARLSRSSQDIQPASDAWPFLYLRSPSLPSLYLRGMFLIGGLALAMLFWLAPGHKIALNGRMFFLGFGFLLLETKAVVHLAVVFGSTWLVNSMVFFSILVMILAANLYVLKAKRVSLAWHYAMLFLCLLLNCLVPLDIFLDGGFMWTTIAPCALVILPVFFAGVIFAVSFRDSKHPGRDMGANIAGAVVGGLAEYSSMLLGFRLLLVVAMAAYALSALFRRGRRGVAVTSPVARPGWPRVSSGVTS